MDAERLTCIQKWKHINEYKNWQQFSDATSSCPIEEFSEVDKVTFLWLSLFTYWYVGAMISEERTIMLETAFIGDEMLKIFNMISMSFICVAFFKIRGIIKNGLFLEAFNFLKRLETNICLAVGGCRLFCKTFSSAVESRTIFCQFVSFICFEFSAMSTFSANFIWINSCPFQELRWATV